MKRSEAIAIICGVVAGLCFVSVIAGMTGDANPLKVTAIGGLFTLGAIFL